MICATTVAAMLRLMKISRRQISKEIPEGHSEYRNAQFENIEMLQKMYLDADNPVLSIDTKAKEHLGQLHRKGRVYTQKAEKAYNHDFPKFADGVVIPHGIYDIARNHGHLNLGTSSDTSQFACDSFLWYWAHIGQAAYPNATSILWLCDGGGSNAANRHIFKQDLQELVNAIGIPIRIAHYPSYCSKFNPIERRFFPHVTRACEGILLKNMRTAAHFMGKATTRTGLRTTIHIMDQAYETGRRASKEFRENMPIVFDELLAKWNYTAYPKARCKSVSCF